MREKIIDTAIEEFTKHGSKFTMSDVAKELGISKKTIYTIFESKQDVLVGIADRYARDFTDMREAIEQDDSLDTLEKLERLFCAIPTKYYNIGLSRLFEVARKYPKQYRYLMEAVNQGWILAEQYLERGSHRRSPVPAVRRSGPVAGIYFIVEIKTKGFCKKQDPFYIKHLKVARPEQI